MLIKIALVISSGQVSLKELDRSKKTIVSKVIDSTLLEDESLSLILLDNQDELSGLEQVLRKESKYYPIVSIDSIGLTKAQFNELDYQSLLDLYTKISGRWVLSNNITTVEQIYPNVTHLRELWVKDRNSFFEELWFMLKVNTAAHDLTIIFNDLKEPSEKQKEKGEKPSLCRSYVQGEKLPNLFKAKEKENILMQEYEKEFTASFNVTEFNPVKGQLVACAKINLSPILIMAKIPALNQLQQSIITSIFTGLQD